MEKSELYSTAAKAEEIKDWSKALELYQELLEVDYTIFNLSKIGWCFSRLANYDNAIYYFKKCAGLEPQKAQWLYMIGFQYYSQSDFLESIKWFEKSIELYPGYLNARYRVSYAYLKTAGSFKQLTKAEFWKAIGHLKSCHELWNNFNDEEKIKNKSIYFDICSLHGKTLSSLENHLEQALNYLLIAHSIKSDENNMYQISKVYFKKTDYKSAMIYLPKSNKYYVKELEIDINIEMKNYDIASEKIKQLLQFRKRDYIYIKQAKIHFYKLEYKDAYKCIINAINANANNHINHYLLAKVSYELGLYNLALKEFETSNNLKIKKFGAPLTEAVKLIEYIKKNNLTIKKDDELLLIELTESKKEYGQIIRYNNQKGFGFIESKGKEIFFHITSCLFKKVTIGKKVSFNIENSKKGFTAKNINYI